MSKVNGRKCEICGKSLQKEQCYPCKTNRGWGRFCSRQCNAASRRGVATCVICKAVFPASPSRVKAGKAKTCSPACLSTLRKGQMGKRTGGWKGGKVQCVCKSCGASFAVHPSRISDGRGVFCSPPCHLTWTNKRKDQWGVKNPNWQGGASFEPYPIIFNEQFKRQIRERDSYTCTICGALDSKDVHHINYIKDDTAPGNCTTLCRSCHGKTGVRRDYWQAVLTKATQAKGGEIIDDFVIIGPDGTGNLETDSSAQSAG